MDNIFYTNIVVFLMFMFIARGTDIGTKISIWAKLNDTVSVWTFLTWMWLSVLSVPAFIIYKIWSA